MDVWKFKASFIKYLIEYDKSNSNGCVRGFKVYLVQGWIELIEDKTLRMTKMLQLHHISWNWTQKYYYFESFGISQE